MSTASVFRRVILISLAGALPVVPLSAATRSAAMLVRAEVVADCSFGGLDPYRRTVLTTCRGDAPFKVAGPQRDTGKAVELITIIF